MVDEFARRHDHTNAPSTLASRGFFITMHDRWHSPQTLVTTEDRGACRPYPGWCRHSLSRSWPGAVSPRAAEQPSLVVSVGVLVPCDVSERSIWICSPSIHSYEAFRYATTFPYPLAAMARRRGGDGVRLLDRPTRRWSRETGSHAPHRRRARCLCRFKLVPGQRGEEEGPLSEHTHEKHDIQHLEPEQLRCEQDTKGESETTQHLQDFPGVITAAYQISPAAPEAPSVQHTPVRGGKMASCS